MKLYLLQHGTAVAKASDPERPLTEQGKRDAQLLGEFLQQAGVRVARIVHSDKTRARQSAQILARAMESATPEGLDGITPNDPVMPFADRVAAWDQDTLVVGHLPFLAKAACLLLTGNEEHAVINFRPGTVVCLERESDGPWGLAWMIRPELLVEPLAA